jgi:hypothetical protein
MYPFLALTPLPADIKHTALSQNLLQTEMWYASLYAKLAHCEPCLVDTSRLCTSPENVGFGRCVVWCRYSLSFIKEATFSQHHCGL